jgi:multidrug efflux pump subunit AcrA (membrane-fusion protein)
VNGTVSSTQVGQLAVGDQATITVSGSTSNVFGTLTSVSKLASSSSGASTFPIVVDVTGSPSGIYGGSSATMSIVTKELQDVVVVPTSALSYSGNNTTVTLDSGGAKVTRTVTIGAASGGNTQVTSGLVVGDKIYVTEISFRAPTGGTSRAGGSSLFGGSGTSGLGGASGGSFPSGAPTGGFGG